LCAQDGLNGANTHLLHGTTILSVRKDDKVVRDTISPLALPNLRITITLTLTTGPLPPLPRLQCIIGDGQVSLGSTVMKPNAKKVRRIGNDVVVGFAGSTADAMTLLERLEGKLEEYPGQMTRSVTWRHCFHRCR